ncbi:lysosomal-trafficking regulator isoform X1 [Pieris napi]|uniref:lysosomal-trafficking regulator isoform X1 n=2 Tax=Pieris napi TaxID=78633 RepID=UPI001FBB803A|nr:lysosomal-trafficking regulator isoform X1 [Pieris napi]XP_047508717.1 lysosomal-trafficking regulator isoform X1 [Pieris napi]
MASEEGANALKVYWEHFFKAETGTYEKSTWLDLFLAEFIVRLDEGCNPKELIKFCPVSGVVSLVGCELLCGIHRVTSSINTQYTLPLPATLDVTLASGVTPVLPDIQTESSETAAALKSSSLFTRTNTLSSAEILRQYLLTGLAWRCLLVLKALGVEGLSCCRQLSSVLIWLFGELSAAGHAASTHQNITRPPTAPIHQLFSNRIWSKQKANGNQTSTSPGKGSIATRSRYNGLMRLDSDSKSISNPKKKIAKKSEASSESGDGGDDLQALNRSLGIKACTPYDDLDYCPTPPRSSDLNDTLYSDPYFTPRKAKPKADDFMKDKHKEIINSEISTFEFTLIIIDLLQELCRAESSLTGSEGSQISMQCINFSLKNLCSLQFGSIAAQSSAYDPLELSSIKVALTELLIVSLDQVLIHADLCAKLINVGILPMLLRILEDVVCKSCAKYNTKTDRQNRAKNVENPNLIETSNLLKFVFGIAYSVTAFFYCLLMQCRTVEKLREFTDQFRLYGECFKGGLLKECIELMIRVPRSDSDEAVTLIKKLIESIGKLVSGMKRVRSEVIHSAACPRSRHKPCRQRVTAGMHHHHDILGEAGAGLPMPTACCVSVLYATLTSLVPDEEISAHKVLRNKILHVMLKCGVCCCFSPSFLMESIVRLMLTHNSVATLCLRLLEHTVYGDLGASVLVPKVTDQLPCSICEQCDDNKDLGRKYCAHGVSPMERKSVWSFLIHYNSLLQLDNHNSVLHATVTHLLKVTPKCRMEMKYELLFSVIYPTFIVSKHRYTIRLDESAYFLTVSSLNIFASLLNTVSFAEQFIQKGGLSYVLELISLPEFSSQCCAILEIAIIVEIYKLMKENAELTYFREMSSLASVQMLFKSLSEVTDKCFGVFKSWIPLEKSEVLREISEIKESLGLGLREGRKFSEPITIKSPVKEGENEEQECLEVLKTACTFWRSCAGLCVHSREFAAYTARENALAESYALLRLVLHALCRPSPLSTVPSPAALRLLVKILEAVLTVQFALTDATSGRSKEVSCEVVRSALSEYASTDAWRDAAGGLRALCDALVAVAVTRPRPRIYTSPRSPTNFTKVPSLSYGSEASSAELSSSEESVCGPYLEPSEHSDPLDRPDDGYEVRTQIQADVEQSKLEATNMFKTRKLSDSSIFSYVSGDNCIEAFSKECPEYNRNGELTHPELCVIVVDILTQLIDKLLEEEDGKVKDGKDVSGVLASGGEEIERVCASVARACVARLGSGLAPPRLLHRLLAHDAPAARLLARNSNTHAELQRSIIELIVKLGSQSMESCELASIFRLASSWSAPLGPLCRALGRLAARDPQPDCELLLTVTAQPTDEESTFEEVVGAVNQQAETSARRIRFKHLRAGITSPWSNGAVRCSLETAGWAPWLQGFGLLVWLSLTPPQQEDWQEEPPDGGTPRKKRESNDLLHIFSVGHDSLVFELWANPNNGELTVRLTRPEDEANCVLSSATTRTALRPSRWTCLALNVTERLHRRLIYIQVTLYVNGRENEVLSLPLQGILVRKATPSNILLGDVKPAGTGSVRVSSIRVYRAPVLTAPAALHLAAHGPDMPCEIRCESANYPLVITPELLDMDLDWDQVYEIPSTTLRELNDNLLLLFSANSPDVMNLYQPPAPTPTAVFGGRSVGGRSLCSNGVPESLRCTWAVRARPHPNHNLHNALLSLGGPELVLFLYARVVEAGGTAEQQAAALGVALSACRGDARLYAALHARDTLDMLLPIFACADCRLGPHTLAIMFKEACDRSVIEISGGAVRVDVGTRAVLLEPRLLLLLLRASRYLDSQPEVQWEEVDLSSKGEDNEDRDRKLKGELCGGSVWSLALAATRALLRPTHPRRTFNAYQAARVPLLRHLLLACKERFLNSDSGPLSERGSLTLVQVVRTLLDAPPLLANIALLADFLLLMHQASETFITHSRANFYFLVTSETPDSTEFNLLQLLSKRRGKQQLRKWRSRDTIDKSSSSSISNEDKGSREELPPDTDSDKTDNASLDAKQVKSIINTRIKEDRKSVSSTSEYSDATTAEIGADSEADGTEKQNGNDGNEGTDPLKEYVVIDSEDVVQPNVDIYADGLYQQRNVRAGAEPGWSACSGLLLLLRDTVLHLPQDMLPQALGGAIQPEQIAVLANHRCASVRAGVVRVVRALHARDPRTLAAALHNHFYLHLANQISMYDGSWELAEACVALLTGHDKPLEDQLDEEVWNDPDSCRMCPRAPPLLAVLPTCLNDVPLAHNVLAVLRRLVEKSSVKSLHEVALCEVVVRCIAGVGDSGGEGRDLLLEELGDLLSRFAVKVLAGNHSTQLIVDIHHLLSYIERGGVSGDADGNGEGCARAARAAQVQLYIGQLDHLETRLHQFHVSAADKIAGYFSNVLSSAVEGRGSERGEVMSRHGAVVSRAVAFLLSRSPRHELVDEERLLFRLLDTLLAGVSGSGSGRGRWRWGGGAEWAALLGEVFWWAASPASAVRSLQPRLLRTLYCAPPNARDLLAPKDPSHMRKLSVYLLTMIRHIHLAAESEEGGGETVELAITDWARDWAVGSQADLPERPLPAEAERLLRADELRWAKTYYAHTQAQQIAKAVFSRSALAARVCETAMAATRRVVDAQNAERKAFLDHLRDAHARLARAHTRWARTLDAHAHERGVWHRSRGYPMSWQLDSTEGPARVRLRLRRAHLRLPPDKLQPLHRHKTENAQHPPPLRSVLSGGGGGARGARLQRGEAVQHMSRVLHVSVAAETAGELLLTDRAMHFVPDATPENSEGIAWPASSVYAAATRRWCLQERAVEVFVRPSRAHLLAFETPADRTAFLSHLARTHPHIKTEPESLTEAMNQWRNGLITNWEYLMILNSLAGRSYNDLMQYPVMPFVLADYISKILDLTDPASFRDLSKPMAVQNKNREQHYINTYNDLKAARRIGCSPLLSRQPHHYASLYSNSGGVLHYLVRVPPFTEQFLSYQDNNFDMPDRTFHSLATTWRLITHDSPTDVKELIPELYYLPELFYNNEGLELGVRQCGLRVDSVELPRWAADARLFTLAHRQALEAPHVAEGLPHWIDLVFGYKQTGQNAVDAINVFPACTYYGFDPTALEDEVDRTAAEAMVRTYGQAPRQLLRAPHPHRAPDLANHAQQASSSVYAGVRGVRWGRYCGSPGAPPARQVLRRTYASAHALLPLPHARAVVVSLERTALMPVHDEPLATGSGAANNKNSSSNSPNLGLNVGLVSWGHGDGAVRLRRRRDLPPDILFHTPPTEQITTVCTWQEGRWGCALGLSGGAVVVIRAECCGGVLRARTRQLHAHAAPITHIDAQPAVTLLVTSSEDGLIVLWDLHELTYIRTLPNREMLQVSLVAISPTLSDVASVHAPATSDVRARRDEYADNEGMEYEHDDTYKYKSLIRVHTVNGRFVGSVKVAEIVKCVRYSACAEGTSVNCIAVGLRSGAIRLYSSWELRPLAHIPPPQPSPQPHPHTEHLDRDTLSISFSHDNEILFASYADGGVVAWESVDHAAKPSPVRILPAHALL